MKSIFLVIFTLILFKANAYEFIIQPEYNQTICYDNSINIEWKSDFANPLTIFIKTDDNEITPIAQNYSNINHQYTWQIRDAKFFDRQLKLIISDGILIDSTNFSIVSKPEIMFSWPSDIVCLGSQYQIKVEALGNNLKYQWYQDGVLIDGANEYILLFEKLEFHHSGIYSCEIWNEHCEKINSPNISIYVISETQIIEQPQSTQYYVGKDVIFSLIAHQAAVDGYLIPQFRWYRDSVDTQATLDNFKRLGLDPNQYPPKHPQEYFKQFYIYIQVPMIDNIKYEGTHSDRLKIKKVGPEDRVNYICKITGKCGTVNSNYVTIGNNTHFKIIKLTGDFLDCAGNDAKFKIKVEQYYPGTITYRWFKTGLKELNDNEKYSGTKTDMLIVKNVQGDDNFAYYCLVTLQEFNIWERSEVFVIDAETKPSIVDQTRYYEILDPSSYYFGLLNLEIRLNNKGNCQFTWYKDGKFLFKETKSGTSKYKITNPAYYGVPNDAGKYIVHIKNHCGETWSDTITCKYGKSPIRICEGNDTSISVDDNNTDKSKYFYTWKKGSKIITEGTKYSGAKNNVLNIKDVNEKDDDGKYELWGTYNDNGKSFIVGYAWIFVSPKPYMQKDLPDSLVYIGSTIPKFAFVTYTKTQTITYQMYFNDKKYGNEVILFQTNNSQTSIILNFSNNDFFIGDGYYQFYFKDGCGEVWSKKMLVKKYTKSIKIDDSIKDDKPNIIRIVNGVDDYNYNKINVFPNPASELFTVNVQSKPESIISIYSIGLTGIEIPLIENTQLQNSETNLNFDTSKLNNGLNIIKIIIDSKVYIFKLIIIK